MIKDIFNDPTVGGNRENAINRHYVPLSLTIHIFRVFYLPYNKTKKVKIIYLEKKSKP